MTDYVKTLVALVEDANISYTGIAPDYDDIVWNDERTQPSRAECDAAWPQIEVNLANDRAERQRAEAFVKEADPLFFGWQRGENTEQVWLDKVAEIRERFPYSEEP